MQILHHPKISLLGDDSVTIQLGEAFSDPGVVATDNVDGDIIHLVVIDNPVNTLLPDVYDIVYTATDSSGNKSQSDTTSNSVKHC